MTTTQPGRDAVEVRHDGAVATLVMRGSAAGNALGGLLWQQLPEVLDALAVDDNVGAVILTGPEGVFSEGLDLRWYDISYTRIMRADQGGPASRAALLRQERQLQDAVQSLASCPRPVIAVIDGACAGAPASLPADRSPSARLRHSGAYPESSRILCPTGTVLMSGIPEPVQPDGSRKAQSRANGPKRSLTPTCRSKTCRLFLWQSSSSGLGPVVSSSADSVGSAARSVNVPVGWRLSVPAGPEGDVNLAMT